MSSSSNLREWHVRRILKFLSVGVLNTLFGYAIYVGLVFIGLPYLTALLLATVVGVIFNYFSFSRIVFRNTKSWSAFAKFIFAYSIVYVINAAILSFLTESTHINAYIAQAFCIIPSVAISWVLMNFWVYKK
jgi:putative flippase GtrA